MFKFEIIFYILGILIAIFVCFIIIKNIISHKYNSEDHIKYDKRLNYNAKIKKIEHQVVGFKPSYCFRTIVTFDDDFEYISHDTEEKVGIITREIIVTEEIKKDIINRAIIAHKQEVSTKFDSAICRIIDFIKTPTNYVDDETLSVQISHTINCLYLCSAYAIFHANTEQKQITNELHQKIINKLNNIHKTFIINYITELTQNFDKFNHEAIRFKKEEIDPLYAKDNSKENYNILLTAYLKHICAILGIEWYAYIPDDFKTCFDKNI